MKKRCLSTEDTEQIFATYEAKIKHHNSSKEMAPASVQNHKSKRENAKYKDLPIGLTESRGCRYKYFTRKGNPIGRIMCQLYGGKFFSRTYGDTRSRKQAIEIVHKIKLEDNEAKLKGKINND